MVGQVTVTGREHARLPNLWWPVTVTLATARRFNQVGGDQPLCEEVDEGEQQQRFVRGAVTGGRAPVGAAGGSVEVGEGVAVVGVHYRPFVL